MKSFCPVVILLLGIVLPANLSINGSLSANDGTGLRYRVYLDGASEQVAFSPDGNTLAIARAPAVVQLHDAKTGKRIKQIEVLTENEKGIIETDAIHEIPASKALQFSHDSKLIAIGNNGGQLKLFDVQSGKQTMVFDGVDRSRDLPQFLSMKLAHGDIESISFSPDGKTILTSGSGINYFQDRLSRMTIHSAGLIKHWDTQTGKLIADLKNEHSSKVYSVQFSRDGNRFATAGYFSRADRSGGAGSKLWDPKENKVVKTLRIPTAYVKGAWPWTVALNSDASKIAVGLWLVTPNGKPGGSICLFDNRKDEMIEIWKTTRTIRQVDFTNDGQRIVAISDLNSITFWDRHGNKKNVLRPIGNPKGIRWDHFALSQSSQSVAIGGVDAKRRAFVDVRRIQGTSASD